jgi:hypothetical protein
MGTVGLIVLVFGFVFACIAAFAGPSVWPRVQFGWAALGCLILYLILGGATALFH